MRLDADLGGFRVRTLNKARTNLGIVQLRQSMVRNEEQRLAQDYYAYLSLVTDFESIDDLVELGLVRVNLHKIAHGIPDESTFGANIPNRLECAHIRGELRNAAIFANGAKLEAVNGTVAEIIAEIEKYAVTIK